MSDQDLRDELMTLLVAGHETSATALGPSGDPASLPRRLLPAGLTVAPCIYLMHRRPDIYPDPRVPARALPRAAARHLTWIRSAAA
jgi:cytochrome P450